MATSSHNQSLLKQIEDLEPHFGRARDDIRALVGRARGGDHKGVLQNTRLVVETLLRAIVAKKKQTPGRQTLDQLVSKLQSDLPTHIAVHVRTIQAWGNVSAHDHGADLFDEGLEVSDQEVNAALNALVAILTWYRDTHLADAPAPAAAPAAAPPPAAPAPEKKGGLTAPLLGLAALVVGGIVFVVLSRGDDGKEGGDPPPPPASASRTPDASTGQVAAYGDPGRAMPPGLPSVEPLDDFYRRRAQLLPPEGCRPEEAKALGALIEVGSLLAEGEPGAKRPQDAQAMRIIDEQLAELNDTFGEVPFLKAQAMLHMGVEPEQIIEVLQHAAKVCHGFSEVHNLQGKLLFKAGKIAPAIKQFKKAVGSGEGYGAPRVNLALAYLQKGDKPRAKAALDELIQDLPGYAAGYRTRAAYYLETGEPKAAVTDLERATTLNSEDGAAFLLLGRARLETKDKAAATEAFCRAKALGVATANKLCP